MKGHLTEGRQRLENLLPGDERPTAARAKALAGAALPMAGHKGFALAFMIDVLTGCITGGRTSPDIVGDPEARTPQGVGYCFIAIHVASACASDAYEDSLSRLVHRVHSAPRAEWAEPFLIPGEPEARTRSERSAGGVVFRRTDGAVDIALAARRTRRGEGGGGTGQPCPD